MYIRCSTPRAVPLRVTQSNQMKEGGTLSPRDRYRLGIIGAFVGLTLLLLPVRGDGSVEGLAEQRTSPPVLTCSEAPTKSVGPVAYATGKTTGASGAERGQALQAQYGGCQDQQCRCRVKYNLCKGLCGVTGAMCREFDLPAKECDLEVQRCEEDCDKQNQACLSGN